MLRLSDNNPADAIEAFNSTSRYVDDLLNIDNLYFEQMVGQIYPTALQLDKSKSFDTEASLDLALPITNGIVLSNCMINGMIFIMSKVNSPSLDGDVPRCLWCISFAAYSFCGVCANVDDFNYINLFFNAKSLRQGYRYYKNS